MLNESMYGKVLKRQVMVLVSMTSNRIVINFVKVDKGSVETLNEKKNTVLSLSKPERERV